MRIGKLLLPAVFLGAISGPDGVMATASPGIPQLPSIVELPYKSGIVKGTGYHHKEANFAANPFMDEEVPITTESKDLNYNYETRIATSQENFSSKMRATASVGGHGWGVKAQVNFAMDRMDTFSASEVLFITHIDKDFGFTGWAKAPHFTTEAKELLCKNGSDLNQQAFEDAYGTYYVVGVNLGTVLDLYVSATSSVSSSDERIDASMSLSWDSAGKGLDASGSFANQLSEDKSLSNVRIWAHTAGIPKEWTPTPTLNTINVTVEEYKTRSDVGGGVSLRLARYAVHDDYIKTVNDCKEAESTVSVSELYIQQLTDLMIEAKVMSTDMLHRNPTDCIFDLFNQTEAVIDQYSNMNMVHIDFPVVTEAAMALNNIKNQWEPMLNKCTKNVKMCHCLDPNDPHFAKNGFVCDGDTADTPPRYCRENEVCSSTTEFTLDDVDTEGCRQVPMCKCQHPNGLGPDGVIGMNGWTCDDGSGVGWCQEWQECYSTSSWKKGAEQNEGCRNAKVCQCSGQGKSFDCWEETDGDRKPIYDPEHTACGDKESCWNTHLWNYGDWSDGCARTEGLTLEGGFESLSNCTKSDTVFKGKPVKLVTKDPEECFLKCQANENINLCKGWAWKASSKRPCRLYKKNKLTKAKNGIVMGKRNCHPYEGKVEKNN